MMQETTSLNWHIDALLRPLGITRNRKAYHILRDVLCKLCEQEECLGAVQKEIYEPLAEQYTCTWTSIQSTIRRAAQTAWTADPERLQTMAGYPLERCPSAVQFLEILYNALVRE